MDNAAQNSKGSILTTILAFSKGYSEVAYRGNKYGVSLTVYNSGKSFKMYAEKHGGKNVVSFNLYHTTDAEILRPCEMSCEKVLDFLNNSKPIND